MTTADPNSNRTKGKIGFVIDIVKDSFTIKGMRFRAHLADITGYGKSITTAKADLEVRVRQALERLDTDPAFARDDDGSLIVAVQNSYGVVHWRITPDNRVRSITATDGPPRRSLEGTWHYEVLDNGS
jgi:hypothetical protein